MVYERDAVLEEVYKGYKVQVVYDTDPSNPREWNDGNAVMITWEREYASPDDNWGGWGKYDESGPDDFRAWLAERKRERHSADPGVVYLWLDRERYNGGISTMTLDHYRADYADGVIYATYEMIREWQGTRGLTAKMKADALAGLADEVETYSLWATGEVFGYIIGDDDDDHKESCWGFIGGDGISDEGSEYCMREARSVVDSMIAHGDMPAPSDEDCEEDAEEEIAEYVAHFPNAAD